jgi:hypothetical protein
MDFKQKSLRVRTTNFILFRLRRSFILRLQAKRMNLIWNLKRQNLLQMMLQENKIMSL